MGGFTAFQDFIHHGPDEIRVDENTVRDRALSILGVPPLDLLQQGERHTCEHRRFDLYLRAGLLVRPLHEYGHAPQQALR